MIFSVIGQPVPFLLGPHELKVEIATEPISNSSNIFFMSIIFNFTI